MNKVINLLLKYSQWIVVFLCLILLDYKYELISNFNIWLNPHLIAHNFEPINIWQILLPKQFVVDLFYAVINTYYDIWIISLILFNGFLGLLLVIIILSNDKLKNDVESKEFLIKFIKINKSFNKFLTKKTIFSIILFSLLIYMSVNIVWINLFYYSLIYSCILLFTLISYETKKLYNLK